MHESWMDEARCRTLPPETFFPHNGSGVVAAAKICARCDVRDRCLEHALAHHIADGVWGGCSERQRRRILKARREEVEAAATVEVGAELPEANGNVEVIEVEPVEVTVTLGSGAAGIQPAA